MRHLLCAGFFSDYDLLLFPPPPYSPGKLQFTLQAFRFRLGTSHVQVGAPASFLFPCYILYTSIPVAITWHGLYLCISPYQAEIFNNGEHFLFI